MIQTERSLLQATASMQSPGADFAVPRSGTERDASVLPRAPPLGAAPPPLTAVTPPRPRALQVDLRAADVTAVSTVADLHIAVAQGALDIEIRAHLDLTLRRDR